MVVEVGGIISDDTTWDADLVRVVSSVEVTSDAALTITPGTRVEFVGFSTLIVRGRLWAAGEPDQMVVFTAEDQMSDEGWAGIEFNNVSASNDPSLISHCEFSYARGLSYDPLPPESRDDLIGGTACPEAGGALTIIGTSNLGIVNSIFYKNSAGFGGAIFCCYHAAPLIAGNLFIDNEAEFSGSVLYTTYSYPRLYNNTLVNNRCLHENIFYQAAALESHISKPPLINNIIRSNFTNFYSGAQLIENKEFYTLYNNIELYAGGTGNIDLDAEFLLSGDHPYSLLPDSPCIDAGMEAGVVEYLPERDLIGHLRVSGDGIDMGAYEFDALMDIAWDDDFDAPEDGSMTSSDPGELRLACFPNPIIPANGLPGRISFALTEAGPITLELFDLQGRLVKQFADKIYPAGTHTIAWDGRGREFSNLLRGVFILRLETSNGSLGVKTMVLE